MVKTVSEFWDLYESELAVSVAKKPSDYALRTGDTPELYAQSVRRKFYESAETSGLGTINLGSDTFKRVARRLGIVKTPQKALKELYATLAR